MRNFNRGVRFLEFNYIIILYAEGRTIPLNCTIHKSKMMLIHACLALLCLSISFFFFLITEESYRIIYTYLFVINHTIWLWLPDPDPLCASSKSWRNLTQSKFIIQVTFSYYTVFNIYEHSAQQYGFLKSIQHQIWVCVLSLYLIKLLLTSCDVFERAKCHK